MTPPFWLPVLSSDIRKLPSEGNTRRNRSKPSTEFKSRSGSVTDDVETSTTAVSVADSSMSSTVYGSRPSVRYTNSTAPAKRKKQVAERKSVRYWSEYDYPEDGSDDGEYYIYVDPDAEDPSMIPFKDTFTKLFQGIKNIISRGTAKPVTTASECEPLLGSGVLSKPSFSESSIDSDSSTSSDEEDDTDRTRYGTIFHDPSARDSDNQDSITLLLFSAMSLFSSTTLSLVLLVLSEVSRHRAREEVDVVTIIGVTISLLFGLGGFWGLVLMGQAGFTRWMVGVLAFGLIAAVNMVLITRATRELRNGT